MAVLVARPALAQEEHASPWTVETGESRLVEVGPFERFVVLDADRIEVERAGSDTLRVTGLLRTGLGVVYVFGESGVESLVFDVTLPRRVQVVHEATTAPDRPHEQVHFTTLVSAGGTPSRVSRLDQRLHYDQEYGDTQISSDIAWSVRSDLSWWIPLIRLQARHRTVSAGIGDTFVIGAELPAPIIRGMWTDWSRLSGLGPTAGVVAGFYPTLGACCRPVDTTSGGMFAARGGYHWRAASVVGAAGAAIEPGTGTARPMAHLVSRFRHSTTSGVAEVRWSGGGLGAAGGLWVIADRFRTYATSRYLQRGYTASPLDRRAFDDLHTSLGAAWRVTRPVEIAADLDWRSAWQPEVATRHVFGPRATVLLTPKGPHSLTLGYGMQDSVAVVEGAWRAEGAVQFLSAVHAARFNLRSRLTDQVLLDFDGAFRWQSLRLTHESRLVAAEHWRWGVSAHALLRRGPSDPTGRLMAGAGRETAKLAFFVQAGASTVRQASGTTVRPGAWAEVEWLAARGHVLGAWASAYGLGSEAMSWSATAQYTLSRVGDVGPKSPLSLRGGLTGTVFHDRNGDGAQDLGDPGVSGIMVHMDEQRWAVTDALGQFVFRGAAAGTHEVVVQPEPWTLPRGNRRRVEVDPLGRTRIGFALRPAGGIAARVFLDRDGNRRFTQGDLPAPVPTLLLRDEEGAVFRRLRVEEGKARADHVEKGSYSVGLDPTDLPPGWLPLGATHVDVELEAGQQATVDLPLRAVRAIGGTVFTGWGEVVGGVSVSLSTGRQVRADDLGRFLFRDVEEGRHEVVVAGAPRLHVKLGPAPNDVLGLEVRVTDLGALEDALAVEPDAVPDTEERAPLSVTPTEVVARLGDDEAPPLLLEVRSVPVVGLETSRTRLDLEVGEDEMVRVWATYVDGRMADRTPIARWVSSDTDLASVDGKGRVIAHAIGAAEIHAELGGIRSESIRVRVVANVAGLVATLGVDTLVVDSEVRLEARARLVDGSEVDVTDAVRWTSSAPETLDVTATGVARARGAASGVEVQARWMGVTSEPIHLRVVEGPISDPVVSPASPVRLIEGETLQLRASGTLPTGALFPLTPLVRWSVDDPAIVSVSHDGVLTGLARGRTTVRATYPAGGPTVEVRVVVRP
ncbi:MAG: Ig-like domain-containing protein [Deltaproteobacteria bacterium]|nr:Ig-like domain-containing protein [Deltaproteobacteria bacterium]